MLLFRKAQHLSKIERFAYGCIILGIALAATAVMLSINHSNLPKSPVQALTAQSILSSVKPSSQVIANYNVPASNPKYISIPAIHVDKTRILKLGLTSGKAIAVPTNIYDTGWYDGSSLPGQTGAMFIYGHVSSWAANGVFYNLKNLKTGDRIIIIGGDNKAYIYQVVSTKVYPYNAVNMNQVLSPINSKPGLNLMTCTGTVIKGTSEFNERLVVFANLVSD